MDFSVTSCCSKARSTRCRSSSASLPLADPDSSFSTSSTSSFAGSSCPNSKRASALRYFAFVFVPFRPNAKEQSSSASAHFCNLMYAKARFECRMECKSLGASATCLDSTNQMPFENHLTASSTEPFWNKLLAWFFTLSMPALLHSTLTSGKGSTGFAAGDAFGDVEDLGEVETTAGF